MENEIFETNQAPTVDLSSLEDIKKDCRNCQNFILFNKINGGARKVLSRRGMCLYGEFEGDYGLYMSSTSARNCQGYIYNPQMNYIFELHQELRQDLSDLLYAITDKRTKEYRDIKPILDGIDEYRKVKKSKGGFAFLSAWKIEEKVAAQYHFEKNRDKYRYLHNLVKYTEQTYNKFLAELTIQTHDRFCNCNKLELNLEKFSEVGI